MKDNAVSRTIRVDCLTRVEGEGAVHVRIRDGRVAEAQLRIFEPPRFFEAFLRGRSHAEAPDITARICGICPVAYQISSVQAMENAFGTVVAPGVRALRRLLYCGEWIESHALHVAMLHAPDFLGYAGAVEMSADHPDLVRRALALKKAGNAVVALLGGREIHPVNVRIGGFYRTPSRSALSTLEPRLEEALDIALELVRWTATLPIPEHEDDYEFVALSSPDEYAICEGRIRSTRGLDIAPHEYEEHFAESRVAHSHALHSLCEGRPYVVGPLARFNLNFERLPERARTAAVEAGLQPPIRNPFRSIVVRAVEIVFAVEEALRIIRTADIASAATEPIEVREAVGHGCSEAPRGLLYHRYHVDGRGVIADAKIVPPTSQNQKSIEHDLVRVVEENLALDLGALTARCETAVRNYDPCISCATHFLRLTVERS